MENAQLTLRTTGAAPTLSASDVERAMAMLHGDGALEIEVDLCNPGGTRVCSRTATLKYLVSAND